MASREDPRLRTQAQTDPRLRTAGQRVQDIRQRSLEDREFTAEAQRLDREFTQVTGNVKEIKDIYNSIPVSIRQRMQFNPEQLQKQINTTKNNFKTEIQRNDERIKSLRERERAESRRDNPNPSTIDRLRADEDRLRAENRILTDAIKMLESGTVLNESETLNIARQAGREERQRSLGSFVASQQNQQLAQQVLAGKGEITAINYETGQVVVDGQRVNLTPKQVENLKLSSQARSEVKEVKTSTSASTRGFTTKAIMYDTEKKIVTEEVRNDKGETIRGLTRPMTPAEILNVQPQIKAREKLKKQGFDLKPTSFANDILNKGLTGQTMTPQELQIFQGLELAKNNTLRQDAVRAYKFTKGVGRELKNIGKEVFGLAVGLVAGAARVQQRVIEGGINYFTPLVIMSMEGKSPAARTQIKNDIKNIVGKTIKTAKKTNQGILDVKRFIRENPQETLTMIAGAAALGAVKTVVTVKKGTISITKAALANPERAVAEVIFFFFPVRKTVQALSKVEEVSTRAVSRVIPANLKASTLKFEKIPVRSYETSYRVSQNLKTGGYSVRMNTKGITKKGDNFTANLGLRYDVKTGALVGTNKITVAGKSKTTNLNLIDRGKFFEDAKTKLRIPKDSLQVKNQTIRVNEVKTRGAKTQRAKGFEGTITTGVKETKDIRQFVAGEKVTEVLRGSSVKFQRAFGAGRDGKLIRDYMEMNKNTRPITTALNKPVTKRTASDYDTIINLINSARFDLKVFNNVNRAERFKNMLRVNDATAARFVKDVDKLISEGYAIKRTGRAISTGVIRKQDLPFRLSYSTFYNILDSIPNFQPRALTLRTNKKGAVRGLSRLQKKTLEKVTPSVTGFNVQTSFSIPSLNSTFFLPRSRNLVRGVKIPSRYFTVGRLFSNSRFLSFQGKTAAQRDKAIKKALEELKKVKTPEKVKKPAVKQKPKTKVKQVQKVKLKQAVKTKPAVKQKPKTKVKTPAPLRPKIPKTLPKKPRRVPRLRLPDFRKEKRSLQNTALGEISYIITNPKTKKRDVIKVRTGLPFNEAVALGRDLVDNTILASFEVRPYGKKEKRLALERVDLKKFTSRRGKDSRVRELVEKSKFRLDTKGETKQISQARIRAETIKRANQIKKFLESKKKSKK